jgi:hypothetical protein
MPGFTPHAGVAYLLEEWSSSRAKTPITNSFDMRCLPDVMTGGYNEDWRINTDSIEICDRVLMCNVTLPFTLPL